MIFLDGFSELKSSSPRPAMPERRIRPPETKLGPLLVEPAGGRWFWELLESLFCGRWGVARWEGDR